MAKIQVRRDSASNWTSVNPVLSSGEFGYETDTGKFKIGNGSANWETLTYFSDGGGSGGGAPGPYEAFATFDSVGCVIFEPTEADNSIIGACSDYFGILGGQYNRGQSSDYSTIVGGLSNGISNCNFGSVLGGLGNKIISSPYSDMDQGEYQNIHIIGSNIRLDESGYISNGVTSDCLYVNNLRIWGGGINRDVGQLGGIIFADGTVQTTAFSASDGSPYVFDTRSGNVGTICATHDDPATATGTQNDTNLSWYSTIAGGRNNSLNNSQSSFIGGGAYNSLGNSESSFIGGGGSNDIRSANFFTMGGGLQNSMTGGWCASLLGGWSNGVSSDCSTVCGGKNNFSGGMYGCIAGGRNNSIKTQNEGCSFIGGGRNNQIDQNGKDNVICGGSYNLIEGSSTGNFIGSGGGASGGTTLDQTTGGPNKIGENCTQCSILSGRDNWVQNGLENTHIIGSHILGAANNTTYVNNFTVKGISSDPFAMIIFNNLPTTDPTVAGAVWNDGGVLKISSG